MGVAVVGGTEAKIPKPSAPPLLPIVAAEFDPLPIASPADKQVFFQNIVNTIFCSRCNEMNYVNENNLFSQKNTIDRSFDETGTVDTRQARVARRYFTEPNNARFSPACL